MFFFKQKTAYEMRISDWSSDVCSSDLYQDVVVKPERSRDWELGLKTSWFDDTLLFNANLYWNDIYNYQGNVTDTTSYRDAQGNVVAKTYLGNIDHVRLKGIEVRSEEHTSELQSLMRISYAVFCLNKKNNIQNTSRKHRTTHT